MDFRVNSKFDYASNLYKLINGANPQDLAVRPYCKATTAQFKPVNTQTKSVFSVLKNFFRNIIKGK